MLKLLDCTLRDGGNILGCGFDADITKMIIEGLIASNIRTIEMGNSIGIGAYEADNFIAPCTDLEYLEAVKPYVDKADIGMFLVAKNGTDKNIGLARDYGLSFLRVGVNAGGAESAADAVRKVKEAGLVCRFSLMEAYLLTPEELAAEGALLEKCGIDEITMMDTAGTMTPDDVRAYVGAMKQAVSVPVGFHGHNNMGFSVANALTAYECGAEVLDCGLLGLARSAGNCATELVTAAFQRSGMLEDIDLLTLLAFEEEKLIPAMEKYGYHAPVKPIDLILGITRTHSRLVGMFREVAEEKNVNLYKLIIETSKTGSSDPSKALMESIADRM